MAAMNKTKANMEQMVDLIMLALTIGLLIGEAARVGLARVCPTTGPACAP